MNGRDFFDGSPIHANRGERFGGSPIPANRGERFGGSPIPANRGELPKFTITRPTGLSSARAPARRVNPRHDPIPERRPQPRSDAWRLFARRYSALCFWSAVLAHAAGALLTGSLDPTIWPRLVFWGCALIIAPLIAFAIVLVEGMVRR